MKPVVYFPEGSMMLPLLSTTFRMSNFDKIAPTVIQTEARAICCAGLSVELSVELSSIIYLELEYH